MALGAMGDVMRTEQKRWTESRCWEPAPPGKVGGSAQLVFLFGSRHILKSGAHNDLVRKAFPQAHLLGCSTAGEIYGTHVSDDSLVTTAVQFDHTQVRGARIRIGGGKDSYQAGKRLAQALCKKRPVHRLVLSGG